MIITTKTAAADARASRDSSPGEPGITRVESEFDAELLADPWRTRDAIDSLRGSIEEIPLLFGGAPLPTSLKPHFIRRSDNDRWTRMLADLLKVLEATAAHLQQDPQFRNSGPFTREAWELLDIDPGYSRYAVVCRPDVVWNGTSIGLLEVNADSPAMMLYADALQELQRGLFPLSELAAKGGLSFDRRVPALLDSFLATYREWGGTSERPVIAIVDWRNQKTANEQQQLARQFTALGYPSFTCSPDELEVRGGRLLGRGEPIDIVQRRLLFPEILARQAELGPFLTAYRERLACVVNPLRSYLVGCKGILAEVSRRARAGQLTDAQRHIVTHVLPYTAVPQEMSDEDLAERGRWVIKPAFGSGGKGVIMGRYVDAAIWSDAVEAARSGQSIVQAYLPIPLYRVPLTSATANAATPLYANWNPFFFGGVPAGAICRVSSDPVVGISAHGALIPSVIVEDE